MGSMAGSAGKPLHMHKLWIPKTKSSKRKPFFGTPRKNATAFMQMDIKTLQTILMFDIKNIYFKLGKDMVQQIEGVPMGSPASPALAVAVCMQAEHKFLSTLDATQRKQIVGFRYVDDLLTFVSPNFDTKVLHDMYPNPLQLEEEAIHNNAFRFLQTFTTIRNGTLDIQFYHKNTHRQAQSQTLLKNVVPFDSHWPTHIHTGRVLGALHSIAHHVNSNASVVKGTMELMHEFKQQGMSKNMMTNSLHMAQKQTRCAAFGVAQALLDKPKR